MSILVMSVLIKTPEIGILRTIGCTVGEIYRIFIYQGLIIGGIRHRLGLLDRLCTLLGPTELCPDFHSWRHVLHQFVARGYECRGLCNGGGY